MKLEPPLKSLSSEMIHASTVAIDGCAVVIEGPSGAGKSDLALRLIDRGAALVSDDYTLLTRSGDAITASAPETIAGRIEVRGIGIVELPHLSGIRVGLVVRLGVAVERMPAEDATRRIAGVAIREMIVDPREASAPIKIELALRRIGDQGA